MMLLFVCVVWLSSKEETQKMRERENEDEKARRVCMKEE